ncbi:hypothetical protein ACRC7T_02940 [Segnochrobactraceae bacterium EtOH-i3]
MHKRIPIFEMIPINKLKIDPNEKKDEIFVKLYAQAMTGRIPISITRMCESEIISGFYFRSNNKNELFSKELNSKYIEAPSERIRSGWRPSVSIYWSALAPNGGAYVCSDEETILAAYRKLKFNYIPCVILRPQKMPKFFGEIWIKAKQEVEIVREVSPKRGTEITGTISTVSTYCDTITQIMLRFKELEYKIKSFHIKINEETHYNYMMAAICRRHHQGLQALILLYNNGYKEQSLAIVRMLYEQYINFYLDWLGPELIGPRMQYFSYLLEGEVPNYIAKDTNKILGDFYGLFKNTYRKANITPHGGNFYDFIYRPLSFVIHQQYGNIESQSLSFEKGEEIRFHEGTILLWLSEISNSIESIINNDIGLQ